MESYEGSRGFEEDPVEKEAWEFCATLQDRIKLAANLKHDYPPEHREGLDEQGKNELNRRLDELRYAQGYINEKNALFFGRSKKFQLKVSVADGIYSHLSKKWEVLHNNPGPTIVDEAREITEQHIGFFIKESGNWLIVFGHKMNIEPVFPDPESE